MVAKRGIYLCTFPSFSVTLIQRISALISTHLKEQFIVPTMPVSNRVNSSSFSMTFFGAGGDDASVQLAYNPLTVTGANLATLRDALGALSNAVIVKTTDASYVEVAKSQVNPLDESYSDVASKAILVFQDANLNLVQFAIPAPDESLFGSDGKTLNTGNGLVSAAITNLLLVLNAPATVGGDAGTFAYLRGFFSRRSRQSPRPRIVRASVEPGAGVNPPDAPGT